MTRSVVTFGESMGVFRSLDQGSPNPSHFGFGFGGAESNVAIALARLGQESTWVGRLGADLVGDRIERDLRAEQVQALIVTDTASTGLMVKEQRMPGHSKVTYFRRFSAGSRLRPEDLPTGLIEGSALLHVTGITAAISSTARDTVFTAVERALASGVLVSFDVNHRSSLWLDEEPSEAYRWITQRSNIVFANTDEAALFVDGSTPQELAQNIANLGPDQVIIKLGAEGCYALIDQAEVEEPAIAIQPHDTVGAGDAFVAGYLADLLAGASVQDRLRTAVACGAFACLGPGDWESSPRRKEIASLVATDPVSR